MLHTLVIFRQLRSTSEARFTSGLRRIGSTWGSRTADDDPGGFMEELKQCGARTRKGTPCKQLPAAGRERYAYHGGKTPRGIASPHWKYGMFSKAMPAAVANRFRKAASDPGLLSLVRDAAVIDARMLEVFGSLAKPGGSWDAVLKAKEAILTARRKNDMVALRNALIEAVAAIEAGSREVEGWKEISGLIESRRKLVEAIWKHEIQSTQIVTITQVQVLFDGLAKLVRKGFVELMGQLVGDREQQAARKVLTDISEGFLRLASASVPLPTDTVQ
jgi:hypothetical protein